MNGRKGSVAPSVVEEKSVLSTIEGEEELSKVQEEVEEEEDTVLAGEKEIVVKKRSGSRDSLVSELLSDEDVDMSGM